MKTKQLLERQLAWLREEKDIERTITMRIDEDTEFNADDKRDSHEIATERMRMLDGIEQSLMHYSTVFNPPSSNKDWLIIGLVFGAIVAVGCVMMMLTISQHIKCPCL